MHDSLPMPSSRSLALANSKPHGMSLQLELPELLVIR